MLWLKSLCVAFSTYSKIPVPGVAWSDENRRYSMCFFPLVGALVGLSLGAWLWLCDSLSLGPFLRGAVGAAIPLFITGGIHMDGFMDTMDALSSYQPRERRLEILKDPHTGAFAVIGCAAYLLLFAGIVSEADFSPAPALLPAFVLSRALSAAAMAVFQKARAGGMLAGFARAARERAVLISSGLYLLFCLLVWAFTLRWRSLLVWAAALLCFLYYRHIAYRRFGGVTGDLAGWFVQVTELVCLYLIILGGHL